MTFPGVAPIPLARRALVVALAGFLGWVAGDLLGIGEKFTAISAVIISQAPSLGKSLIRTRRRIVGTIVGVIFGGIALWLIGSGPWQMLLAIFVAYLVAGLAGLGEGARVAALGALAVVIAPLGGPVQTGVIRFLDIAVGALIALVVTVVVYPQRAEEGVVKGFAEILDRLSRALRPVLEPGIGVQAARRAGTLDAELSELQDRVVALQPLIRQSEHEPGARHRHPAVVGEALTRLLAGSSAVATELARLRVDAPEGFSEAGAALGSKICDQLEAASSAIAAGRPVPAFEDAGDLPLALYGETERLVKTPGIGLDTRDKLRLVALSAELRSLAHMVAALEGISIEVDAGQPA